MAAKSVLVCSSISSPVREGVEVAAASVAVMAALAARGRSELAPLVLDLRASSRRARGAVLASAEARRTEAEIDSIDELDAAARGRICFAAASARGRAGSGSSSHSSPPSSSAPADPTTRESVLADVVHGDIELPVVIALADPADFRPFLDLSAGCERGAIVHSCSRSDRALLSLLCFELQAERVPVKVWDRPVGFVPARRALSGLEPGGAGGARAGRVAAALTGPVPSSGARRTRGGGAMRSPLRHGSGQAGQALPAMLGIVIAFVLLALALVAIGGATTAKGRFQRSADLAAISAARSMHDDFARLFVPERLPNGMANPVHLSKPEYMSRARAAAGTAIRRNGSAGVEQSLSFPDAGSFAPLRVRVELAGEIGIGEGAGTGSGTAVVAEAEVAPVAVGSGVGEGPAVASGGGYSGPLEYRQGKPMRPDVAAAFDRMSTAARADGIALIVNSGFRSDAEQQALWNANPDPRWVARPGTSLHRCGTELDLGPSSAYSWLGANAHRFGFLERYSWEPWHFGFTGGPEPCSAEGDRIGRVPKAKADGRGNGEQGLPGFVPSQFRAPLISAASRYDVSAALLAAQLMAESNFNPRAVSSAGAQGIAQFMPATAAAYGLDDPFDPVASIRAQGRMMAELLAQFGSIELALAAYNAGPGAVSACGCIPPYPETQAYVARIVGLLRGFGELAAASPGLEVRLVD